MCAMALALAGCFHADYPAPEMTVAADGLEDMIYWPYGTAVLPPTDLSAIGEASGDFGELVSDSTVYAITGVEASRYVAMQIDPQRYDEYLRKAREAEPEWSPPSTAPTHQLYSSTTAADSGPPPTALCAYFDPRADQTPPECQSAVTVILGGRTYVAVADEESTKFIPFTGFHESDLQPIGTLDDIDPRLSFGPQVNDTAYAIRDVDPATAIVMTVGKGLDAYYYVFVVDGSALPSAVCEFADAGLASLIGCTPRPTAAADLLDEVRTSEELWWSREVVEYSFTITVVCGCPSEEAGAFTIKVIESDHVDSVTLGGAEIAIDDERAAWVPKRISEAFQQVEDHADSELLEVEYDPELGYPLRLFADPSTARDGDEYGFEITELRIDR